MICYNCGREIRDDSKFCAACGAEVMHNQENIQNPVSHKSKRNVVLLIIISMLLIIFLGVVLGLVFGMHNESNQKQDNYKSDNSNKIIPRKYF